ncbi:MAG: radical SAM protein [Elusimicrobia bacterium]|nr:radical SAM protein [Elusimicrobiota bacterium]
MAIAIPALLRGKRGARDHAAATLSLLTRSSRIIGRPMNVLIEPTNVCNLRCPVCETGAGLLGRPAGMMTLEQFKCIIDKVSEHTNTLMFYFMGEPFLNKDAYAMIRYAKDRGIPFVATSTNGDVVDPEKLVDSGIDEVSFQIGGMTQETHGTYRIGSDLARVLRNLRETVRLRDERHRPMAIYPGFILMKHNEHEVEIFRKAMAEMGADEAAVIDPLVRTVEQGEKMLPSDTTHWVYAPDAFHQGLLRPRAKPPNECPWICYTLTVHVNGDVVPCCRDTKGEEVVGNILRQDLEEIWNGDRLRAFRDRLHKDQSGIRICRLCSAYGPSPIR